MEHYDVLPFANMHPELGVLAASMEDSTREWQENLLDPAPPTVEALVWQPYTNGPSIGGALLHMACCELYWLAMVGDGEDLDASHPAVAYDSELDQYANLWPVAPSQPIEWYLDILKAVRASSLERIARHSDPAQVFPLRSKSVSYRWILAHLIEHDSYTGGQAVLLHEMYKRMTA
jgi:uncharacterized damage-inducible protein DinB